MTPGNSLLPVRSMLPTPVGVSTRTIIRLHSYTFCLTRGALVFFQHAGFPWSIRMEMQHIWNRSIIHILTALQVALELWLWFPCRGYAGHLKQIEAHYCLQTPDLHTQFSTPPLPTSLHHISVAVYEWVMPPIPSLSAQTWRWHRCEATGGWRLQQREAGWENEWSATESNILA